MIKAFLSSTYEDLVEWRAKVAEALERQGQTSIRMETFGSRPFNATRACYDEIDEADIFIGIYAHRYGFIPSDSNISITEREYEFAIKQKKPMFVFVVADDHPWKPSHIEEQPGKTKLIDFKAKIGEAFVRDSFTTPDDLAIKVVTSINRYLFRRELTEKLKKAEINFFPSAQNERDQVARRAERLSSIITGSRLLLVNDNPSEMKPSIAIYEKLGIALTLATSTDAAITLLSDGFDFVVSDMSRYGVDDEGIRFLKEMRRRGFNQPVIFTVARFFPEMGTPAFAFGITNRVDELMNLSFDILERIRG